MLLVEKVSLDDILPLRKSFLDENCFQIRYHACHERGWSDSYLIFWNKQPVGYASVKGKDELTDRDALFELYLEKPYRKFSSEIFHALKASARFTYIETQSNEPFLTSLLYEFGRDIYSDVILFEAGPPTQMEMPDLLFRKRRSQEEVFGHANQDPASYVLEEEGEVVADGGFLLHYNEPFADLYMEVREDKRRQGYGSFIIQKLQKVCYAAGRIPAARCNLSNKASRATLLKAGMKICGFMLTAQIP